MRVLGAGNLWPRDLWQCEPGSQRASVAAAATTAATLNAMATKTIRAIEESEDYLKPNTNKQR